MINSETPILEDLCDQDIGVKGRQPGSFVGTLVCDLG